MSPARTLCLLLIAMLGSCSGALPNSAVSRHMANRFAGAVDSATPVAKVIHDRGIRVPDEQSGVPLLEQLQAELAKSDIDGAFAGITYDLTRGNTLPRDWLVQTPVDWGRQAKELSFYPLDCKGCDPELRLPSCASDADCNGGTCAAIWPSPDSSRGTKRKVCLGHSDALVLQILDLIANAQRRVDITLLTPVPDTRFLGALREALATLAQRGRPITVRSIVGHYPTAEVDASAFTKVLTAGLEGVPKARLSVSVAAMRSCAVSEDCDSYSWNHAKIVAVDGVDALVGGHNMWSADYLVDDPVHDLSIHVHGRPPPAPPLADRLWITSARTRTEATDQRVEFRRGHDPAGKAAHATARAAARPSGGIPIWAVGRMGAGITRTSPTRANSRAISCWRGAERHRIVQQDLGFALGRADTLFPESTIDRLIDFLLRRDGDIYIVLSNQGAVGKSGSTYSNGVPLEVLARHLRQELQRRFEARDPKYRYEIRKGPIR
jgi:hypothetical protein